MKRVVYGVILTLAVVQLAGCGTQSSQKKRTIQVAEQSGLGQAKQLLEGYVGGNPVGSEAESYADIVTAVRDEDAAKADILEAGFKEIKADPPRAARKAKELLSRL